jgi:hypothetical protein
MLLLSKGLVQKCVVDSTWDTTQVRTAVKNVILQDPYIGRCLTRVSASWDDVRLCDVISRGGRRKRAMFPRLDVGKVTLGDLLM